MNISPALLLKRSDVSRLLSITECIDAVENAFRLYGGGGAQPPGILGVHVEKGGYHIKAGVLDLARPYFVAKTNANFPSNPFTNGLPTIQGVISVSDAENGMLLALMDSIEITIMRTGAATAVAAAYLSRKNSESVTIIGCGNQGMVSARMLSKVRTIKTIFAVDIDVPKAKAFAATISRELGVSAIATRDVSEAIKKSDICVTCTTSKQPVLGLDDIHPGLFIAAVGADSEMKQELDARILAHAKIVTDVTSQCETIGELHHAIDNGVISRDAVHAELGEIVCRIKPARNTEDEVIVFDSTGMALQDVASSVIVYEKAVKEGVGMQMNFSE